MNSASHSPRTAAALRTCRRRAAKATTSSDALAAIIGEFARWHAEQHQVARIVQYEFRHLSPEHQHEVLGLRREIDAVVRGVVEDGVAHVPAQDGGVDGLDGGDSTVCQRPAGRGELVQPLVCLLHLGGQSGQAVESLLPPLPLEGQLLGGGVVLQQMRDPGRDPVVVARAQTSFGRLVG